MNFWSELKRRNVFRVAAAYVVFAWLVVQVAETLLPIFEVPGVFLRGVILVLVLGFPLAVFFAWAFELTPEGVKREKDVERQGSDKGSSSRKLDRAIILILLVAVGYFVTDKFLLTDNQATRAPKTVQSDDASPEVSTGPDAGEARPEDNSLAVLAFDDMSPENDQEYLADGIAEELLNLLARIPELRLTSRSSSFAFKDRDVSLRRMAEELGVAYILEGSVRKSGEQVRITAQLIDARSDSHMWSRTYDRTLDDIFAIQDDIAASVVDELKVTLLGDVPTSDERDPEAYEFYLRARHAANLGDPDLVDRARALFERALEIDPDFADARLGQAVLLINEVQYGQRAREVAIPRAREIIQGVLDSHPEHVLGNNLMGWLAMVHDNDWAAAARYFERSLETAPTDTSMLSNAAVLLRAMGRLDQAIALYEYVTRRDPLNANAARNLSLTYYDAGRFDEAISAAEDALEVTSDFFGAHGLIGFALLHKGEPEKAAEAFRRERSENQAELGLVLVADQLGDTDLYRQRRTAWLDRWSERYPMQAVRLFAFAGDVDMAFEWLDRETERVMTDLIVWAPELDPLKADPRWQELLEDLGLSPEQLEAIEFDIQVPVRNT